MSNSIVGQSKDTKQANAMILGIGQIGKSITKIAEQLENHEDRLSSVEDTMRVNGIQEKKLTEKVNLIVVTTLNGKNSNAYQDKSIRGKAYSEINKRIKDKYGIPRRGELPAKDYDSAMKFIANWTPDFELKQLIKEANSQMKLA